MKETARYDVKKDYQCKLVLDSSRLIKYNYYFQSSVRNFIPLILSTNLKKTIMLAHWTYADKLRLSHNWANLKLDHSHLVTATLCQDLVASMKLVYYSSIINNFVQAEVVIISCMISANLLNCFLLKTLTGINVVNHSTDFFHMFLSYTNIVCVRKPS